MQPILSVSDIREIEQDLGKKGVSQDDLMRRAGAVVANQAARLVENGLVVVMCGAGNNGGDGWVCADSLATMGYDVAVVTAVAPAAIPKALPRECAKRALDDEVPVHVLPDEAQLEELLCAADVVVDAIFGIGFHGEVGQPYEAWIAAIDSVFSGKVVSVDVPSGIDASTGMATGPFVSADVTVTMFAAKPGLVSGMGRLACGAIVVAGLVSDEEGLEALTDLASAFVFEDADYLDVFPGMDPLQDKYTRGRVLVVAGSSRFPGAAIMAALAAARSGAGYVTLAVPQPVVPIAQAHLLSVPVVGLPADIDGAFDVDAAPAAASLAEHADVVLAGPGMTCSDGACEVVRSLLASPCGLVLDADALNLVVRICAGSASDHPHGLRRTAPLVLTPHRRELGRLSGGELEYTSTLVGALSASQELAWAVGSSNFAIVAKGPVTCVSNVESAIVVAPGPEALATAGTGDVLAGVVSGMLAQALAQMGEGESPDSASMLQLLAGADRVHAVAGELAMEAYGSRGLIATDLIDRIGLAFDEVMARAETAYDAPQGEEIDMDEGLAADEELDADRTCVIVVGDEDQDSISRHAAATAQVVGLDDADLEEPETPEEQMRRLARAQRAAQVRRAIAEQHEPVMPSAISVDLEAMVDDAADRTTVMPPVPDQDGAASDGDSGRDDDAAEADDAEASPDDEASQAEETRVDIAPEKADALEDEQSAADDSSGEADEPGEARDAQEPLDEAAAETAERGQEMPKPGDVHAEELAAAPVEGAGQADEEDAADDAPKIEPVRLTARAVPPFLAHAAEGLDADEPDEGDDVAKGDAPEDEAQAEPVHVPTEEELRAAAIAEFHKRATRHVGVTPKVPPEQRPSARGKGTGQSR